MTYWILKFCLNRKHQPESASLSVLSVVSLIHSLFLISLAIRIHCCWVCRFACKQIAQLFFWEWTIHWCPCSSIQPSIIEDSSDVHAINNKLRGCFFDAIHIRNVFEDTQVPRLCTSCPAQSFDGLWSITVEIFDPMEQRWCLIRAFWTWKMIPIIWEDNTVWYCESFSSTYFLVVFQSGARVMTTNLRVLGSLPRHCTILRLIYRVFQKKVRKVNDHTNFNSCKRLDLIAPISSFHGVGH